MDKTPHTHVARHLAGTDPVAAAGQADLRASEQQASRSQTLVLEEVSVDRWPPWTGSMDLPGMDGDGLPD